MAVLLVGLRVHVGFLPPVESLADDGFQSQMLYVLALLQEGNVVEGAAEGSLIWVHLGRLFAVAPFIGLDAVVGPLGSMVLLELALLPLVLASGAPGRRVLTLAPLALPLALSGRSVLVAVGVGYVILYLVRSDSRSWLLWLGIAFANLSSASMIAVATLLIFVRQPAVSRRQGARLLALVLVGLSLAASIIDKLGGFQSGAEGYGAHSIESNNLLLAVLSRGTLLVSLVEGQYARSVAYLLVAGYLLYKLMVLLRNPRAVLARRIILCCIPGVFLEGLGVVALLFPLLWLITGTLTQWSPVKRRTPTLT
ncbi:hypothetical protein [Rhizobacter sp. LjRoot28]|uniref:hypothetical protein n=1 Tax=Rhizobacter sp. LjRoot28 TaxID=3342309 RepID=UPI003ECC5E97